MDPVELVRASRVVIVAGKGGVGKTTVTGVLAHRAGQAGLRTLVVTLDDGAGLARLFGRGPLGHEPTPLGAGVQGRTLTPDHALAEYLQDRGLGRLSRRLVRSGAVDLVATAAPGIRDILVLGKVKQLERTDAADVILVDAPAAGHALTFLQSARGLLDATRGGPIRTQAAEVLDLLTDARRCSVVLVTLAEETPVNETVAAAFALEERVGVSLGPIVVNALDSAPDGLDVPPVGVGDEEARALVAAAAFRRERVARQAAQLVRLGERLPLPQLRLPLELTASLGPVELETLSAALG